MNFTDLGYLLRWLRVMYDRRVYRKSHEGRFERHCAYVEKQWQNKWRTP